ncbi:MAG: hypothetical protein WCD01_14150 [Candidatus Sulfotelmatobacter sp.]
MAALKLRVELLNVQCLQVTAHVQNGIAITRAQSFHLSPCAKVVVHSVAFAGTRNTAVKEHKFVKLAMQLGIELAQRLVQRSFTDTRRSAKNYEASLLACTHG